MKEITVYRCPNCRKISNEEEWIVTKFENQFQCPICKMTSDITKLKQMKILLYKRGRIWVKQSKSISS